MHQAQVPLSDAAKAYGEVADSDPRLLNYRMDDPASWITVVTYEVQKYLASQHLPLPENEDILTTAFYGMEHHPEYAVTHNKCEQTGDNDLGAKFLRSIGVDIEPSGAEGRLIRLKPQTICDYES